MWARKCVTKLSRAHRGRGVNPPARPMPMLSPTALPPPPLPLPRPPHVVVAGNKLNVENNTKMSFQAVLTMPRRARTRAQFTLYVADYGTTSSPVGCELGSPRVGVWTGHHRVSTSWQLGAKSLRAKTPQVAPPSHHRALHSPHSFPLLPTSLHTPPHTPTHTPPHILLHTLL